MDKELAKRAVVTVGEGRGFIVGEEGRRFVITAAHCLPKMPEANAVRGQKEVTYQLLGPLGGACTTWTEIIFADPIADIAVLGEPDTQEDWVGEEQSYGDLTGPAALSIGSLPDIGYHGPFAPVWLLSLDGKWFKRGVCGHRGSLWIKGEGGIDGGMSGSPILLDDGSAVGVISAGSNLSDHGPNPRLLYSLPGFMVADEMRRAS